MAKVFLWHLGPIVSSSTHQDVIPHILRINYYNPSTSHKGSFWNGSLLLGRYLNKIAAVPARNEFIAEIVSQLHRKEEHILVLSDRLNILYALRDMLAAKGIPLRDIGMFTNKEKQLDRQILLGTYGSADMGADIPRLTALVFATPRVDVVQPIGRVLRNGNPIVVDIVDTASSVMQGWGFARRNYYKRMNYPITEKEYGK
jgi:superfamily II DNA or RNA helicase